APASTWPGSWQHFSDPKAALGRPSFAASEARESPRPARNPGAATAAHSRSRMLQAGGPRASPACHHGSTVPRSVPLQSGTAGPMTDPVDVSPEKPSQWGLKNCPAVRLGSARPIEAGPAESLRDDLLRINPLLDAMHRRFRDLRLIGDVPDRHPVL